MLTMATRVLNDEKIDLSHALALLVKYTLDISRIATETLGPDGVANRDVKTPAEHPADPGTDTERPGRAHGHLP